MLKKFTLLITICLVLGCAWNKLPYFKYGKEGEKLQFKRLPKHLSLDYIHRFTRPAYKQNHSKLHWLLTAKQREIIREHGQPEYLRHFLSDHNETVDEWVYWEKQKVFQFIRGELIFAGPLTDLEKVLIKHGYPDDAMYITHTGEKRFLSFIYRSPYKRREGKFSFLEGKLLYAVETE